MSSDCKIVLHSRRQAFDLKHRWSMSPDRYSQPIRQNEILYHILRPTGHHHRLFCPIHSMIFCWLAGRNFSSLVTTIPHKTLLSDSMEIFIAFSPCSLLLSMSDIKPHICSATTQLQWIRPEWMPTWLWPKSAAGRVNGVWYLLTVACTTLWNVGCMIHYHVS